MFTTPCFIRKNTQELRDKLVNLGYKYITQSRGNSIALSENNIVELILLDEDEISYSIDCGTNEDLFLAIAALRDDTDKGQWFVSNINEWFFNYYHKFRKDITDWTCDFQSKEWHKATAEELIEHFK